jgi:hypothetical protein
MERWANTYTEPIHQMCQVPLTGYIPGWQTFLFHHSASDDGKGHGNSRERIGHAVH